MCSDRGQETSQLAKDSKPGPREDRPPRMVRPKNHDTYACRSKPAQSVVCDRCAVVYHGGRWYWGGPPRTDVRSGLCPACQRIRDRYPAGTIRVGRGIAAHGEEIRGLIANVEQLEKAEHPLERVMDVEESEDGLVVTTTGIHLARRITSRLERRFHRNARIRYPAEQHLIFVELDA